MRNPNGYGSITKLSGKRRRPWIVRITTAIIEDENNPGKIKQIRKTLGYFPTRAAAMQALADYNNNPFDLDVSKMTFAQLYERWSEDKFRKISKSMRGGYTAAFKNCAALHDMTFKDLRAVQLQKAVDESAVSYSSLTKIKTLFSQLYKYAMYNDIVEKDYSKLVSVGKDDSDPKRKPFTEEEIEKLWENIDMPYVDTILIMIYSGWRIGELLDIKAADVDMKELTMRGGLKTAAGKNRIVPIHPKIEPLIRKYYENGAETLITLPGSSTPHPYPRYLRNFAKTCEKLGMNHCPHDCRHTFATLADEAGANVISIKRIMGHSSKDVTEKVYTHKDIAALRKAILLIK